MQRKNALIKLLNRISAYQFG